MAGGLFSKDNRPLLMGAYFNEESIPVQQVLANAGSVVAIPFTHDWGPFKAARYVTSYQQFKALYGPTDTPGHRAVFQAFKGEGVPGRGGAGTVLCYRTGASSAAKATKVLQNTTPAAAVTLTARYEGTFGNGLRVTTQDNAANSANTDLLILDSNGNTLETYTFADTDINGTTNSLVSQINATSNWITATGTVNGVALGFVSSQAFTGGNDGSTLLAGDWTAVMAALEPERFGQLAPYDLTDSTVLTSLHTWAQGQNQNGNRFRTFVGGPSTVVGNSTDDTAATAVSRSASLNDSDWVNIGVGYVHDDTLNVDLSLAQFAPRVAGIAAQRGEVDSLSGARIADVTIKSGATEANKATCFKGGVMCLGRDSNPIAPVRLERAVTTYTTTTNGQKPYLIYRNPKFVAVLHGVEVEFTEWYQAEILGQRPVNNKTRDAVKAELLARLNRRVEAGVIQANPTVAFDQNPPPSDNDEFVAFVIGVKFGRSVEQTYTTLRVG